MGRMYMSEKELDRLHVFKRVCNGEMSLNKAAKLLDISTRQAIRIKQRILKEGSWGVVFKKVGSSSNNRITKEKKHLVLSFLNQEDHRDFGPLLVHKYLSKEHADLMSVSTLFHSGRLRD